MKATFSGLPAGASPVEVLYESPRVVEMSASSLTDWFGPNEVHVYRIKLPGG